MFVLEADQAMQTNWSTHTHTHSVKREKRIKMWIKQKKILICNIQFTVVGLVICEYVSFRQSTHAAPSSTYWCSLYRTCICGVYRLCLAKSTDSARFYVLSVLLDFCMLSIEEFGVQKMFIDSSQFQSGILIESSQFQWKERNSNLTKHPVSHVRRVHTLSYQRSNTHTQVCSARHQSNPVCSKKMFKANRRWNESHKKCWAVSTSFSLLLYDSKPIVCRPLNTL